jgi:hypothetical protein
VRPTSPIDGDELRALFGGGPGEWIGQVKQAIADAITEDTLEAGDRESALHFVRD